MIRHALAIAALLLTTANARAEPPPVPPGSIDHVDHDMQCEDDQKPETCAYTITFEVTEKFVKKTLPDQTKITKGLIAWWIKQFLKQTGDANGFRFQIGFNKQIIGWSDVNAWVWDERYVAAINRRALH